MILPVVKLGTLALRTICKPIANRLKKEAGLHPKFRHVIVNIAQANHRFTTQIQRRIYGHRTDIEIHPLNEEKAVQAAADLLGELFVFTVAGAAVIFEVQRSAKSEARKEEMRRRELEAIKQRDEDLSKEVEVLKQKLEELEQLTRGQGFVRISEQEIRDVYRSLVVYSFLFSTFRVPNPARNGKMLCGCSGLCLSLITFLNFPCVDSEDQWVKARKAVAK
ncbi:hypothetical protein Nepgr_000394 [Nepenthes gracilis]|uniref:OPA3-like protein n=1 Tax=Nepenthes gracilis TaxID=150966 RepID=A0AAD3P4E1_NEPGR|nr:hypothetical protein Nepgr_000394 [Nepenthes gracilis]